MNDLDLPDVNVLIALLHTGHEYHAVAKQWFANTTRFATTPITETGLLYVALNPTVMGVQITPRDALASLQSLRADPRAKFIADDTTLVEPTIDLASLTSHRQIVDMHLINLAVAHQARLVTLNTKIRPALTPEDQTHVIVLV